MSKAALIYVPGLCYATDRWRTTTQSPSQGTVWASLLWKLLIMLGSGLQLYRNQRI